MGVLPRFALGALLLLGACGRSDYFFANQLPDLNDSNGDGDNGTTGDDGLVPTGDDTTTDGPLPDTGPGTADTGPGTECQVPEQCDVADPCQIADCEDGMCVYIPRDADGDGVPPPQCGGDDCNDLNPNTFPGAVENCFDGDDNDCNGVADCFDPVCEGVPDCGCTPAPGGEDCSNGTDDDCDTTVDCNDAECLGTPECGCADSESGLCGNGFDDDCDGALDCDDPDCVGDMVCQCMDTIEQCQGGVDDDCDLLIDCADPDCDGIFPCTCDGVPTPEDCGNGTDDDCDGAVDCADSDCIIAFECMDCSTELCTGGEDEDCDGQIDCADETCAFDPECAPTPEECNNGIDDDGDTLTDCDDPDCAAVPFCTDSQGTCLTALTIPGTGTYTGDTTGNTNVNEGECGGGAGEAVFRLVLSEPSRVILDSIGTSFDSVLYVRVGACAEGQEIGCDDDSGGNFAATLDFTLLYPGVYYIFLDGYTIDPFGGPNEGPFTLNVEVIENPPEQCGNGLDDDGDVYVDCADPDCAATPPCSTCLFGGPGAAEFGTAACTDGIDNDCDGDVDCDDDDCSASDFYITECCNGSDQNGNGIPDDFNCRCNNDSECDAGQFCYDHTANVCGFDCTAFFGDVCPFVAAGSTCNLATLQCEF